MLFLCLCDVRVSGTFLQKGPGPRDVCPAAFRSPIYHSEWMEPVGWNSVGDGEQRASNSRGQTRKKTRFIMISAANAVAVHKAGGRLSATLGSHFGIVFFLPAAW